VTADTSMGEVLVYETPNGGIRVDVRLDRETVWLTQQQMAELFGRERSVITKHVRNLFDDGELEREGNVQNLHIAGSDKPVGFFSLDVIISVGYRVKSTQGTRFRQWAIRVLRDHLVRGFTLHQNRLAERGLDEARQTLDLLARTLQTQALVNDTGRAVLELILSYADAWRLLLEYDEDRLALPPGVQPAMGVLNLVRAERAIATLKGELLVRGEVTPLFGQPRGEGLDAILAAIEQTMFGQPLYASREEKAAQLLYFVI
jgi:Virulence protein RhuM family